MDNFHNRPTFDVGKKNEIVYYSLKENLKIGRTATKFGDEML